MSAPFNVRRASMDDASAINDIYNPFILSSPATFETETYTHAQRRAWFEKRAGDNRYPVFIAEQDNGDALGFASASAFDERDGYRTSVKTSVFVAEAAAGRGIGRALYDALFTSLRDSGLHRAYALIVAPNPASVALHEAFGFRKVAVLSEVGVKFDRFYDVMWFECAL